ncbi:hypothetical protein [Chlamydiifrater volucris]|uniref:hypothetical protein n=1 Tax=Chlamydiifrater volucris TaxID=2681470 RepID=UPI0032B2B2B4
MFAKNVSEISDVKCEGIVLRESRNGLFERLMCTSKVSRLCCRAFLGLLVFLGAGIVASTLLFSGAVSVVTFHLILACIFSISLAVFAVSCRRRLRKIDNEGKDIRSSIPYSKEEEGKRALKRVLWTSQIREVSLEEISHHPHVKPSMLGCLTDLEREESKNPWLVLKCLASKKCYWPSSVHVESNCLDADFAVVQRCKRDWMFVLLGFLSWNEIADMALFCKTETDKERKETGQVSLSFENSLYARCIKRCPNVVAAEAAFFAWMKNSFSYTAKAYSSIFRNLCGYRSSILVRLETFVKSCPDNALEKVIPILERFSGWGPVCLSNFVLDFKTLDSLPDDIVENIDWPTFCKKASDFCNKTVFLENSFGNLTRFKSFVQEDSLGLFSVNKIPFVYKESAYDFFCSPMPLWDMKSLCNEDKELLNKIEEGLTALSNCGYLGEQSLEDIQNFERLVLGLQGQLQ